METSRGVSPLFNIIIENNSLNETVVKSSIFCLNRNIVKLSPQTAVLPDLLWAPELNSTIQIKVVIVASDAAATENDALEKVQTKKTKYSAATEFILLASGCY